MKLFLSTRTNSLSNSPQINQPFMVAAPLHGIKAPLHGSKAPLHGVKAPLIGINASM